jgi:hypothetical protein
MFKTTHFTGGILAKKYLCTQITIVCNDPSGRGKLRQKIKKNKVFFMFLRVHKTTLTFYNSIINPS